MTLPLPEPENNAAFVTVDAFTTATLTAPYNCFVKDLDGSFTSTSWRFFIVHEPSRTKLWFDLGVAPDLTVYPPKVRRLQHKLFNVIAAPNSPVDDMKQMGEDPNDVQLIIASHAHWDHMFPPKKYFPSAKVICGKGTFEVTNDSWPKNKDAGWDGTIWSETEAELPIEELPGVDTHPDLWQPLGPFDHAYDLFKDQSFWLIDAPGHLRGNLAALCRVKVADGTLRWIFLGGDCALCNHFVHFPDTPFGAIGPVAGSGGMHEDQEAARRMIHKIAELRSSDSRVRVWLAHADSLEGQWEMPRRLGLE